MKKISSENRNPNMILPEEDIKESNLKEVKELFKELIEAPPFYTEKLVKKCQKLYLQIYEMRRA